MFLALNFHWVTTSLFGLPPPSVKHLPTPMTQAKVRISVAYHPIGALHGCHLLSRDFNVPLQKNRPVEIGHWIYSTWVVLLIYGTAIR